MDGVLSVPHSKLAGCGNHSAPGIGLALDTSDRAGGNWEVDCGFESQSDPEAVQQCADPYAGLAERALLIHQSFYV